MGLFSKKKSVNYNELFKQKYKYVNKLSQDANNEIDFVVKKAMWQNVVDTYEELIDLIDKGANYDRDHFISLKEHAVKELEKVKSINYE